MADKKITLYSPSGEKYETTSKSEATQLRFGEGYKTTPPKAAESKSKSK